METGPTIKIIRQLKGFTQKEVYGGVVSHSFINRFERGLNDISANKLFAILNNLAITPNEFQFIANHYQAPVLNQYLTTVMNLYHQRSFLALAQWVQNQRKQQTQTANDKLKMAVGYAEVLLIAHDNRHVIPSDSMNYLLSATNSHKQWTLQEIKMANILIPIIKSAPFSKTDVKHLIIKMESSCQKYLNYDSDFFGVLKDLTQFYGVLLQGYLNERLFRQADQLINKFQQIDKKLLDLDGNINLQFWEAIWGLYFDNYEQNKQRLADIMNVIKSFPISNRSDLQDIYRVRLAEAKWYRKEF